MSMTPEQQDAVADIIADSATIVSYDALKMLFHLLAEFKEYSSTVVLIFAQHDEITELGKSINQQRVFEVGQDISESLQGNSESNLNNKIKEAGIECRISVNELSHIPGFELSRGWAAIISRDTFDSATESWQADAKFIRVTHKFLDQMARELPMPSKASEEFRTSPLMTLKPRKAENQIKRSKKSSKDKDFTNRPLVTFKAPNDWKEITLRGTGLPHSSAVTIRRGKQAPRSISTDL